MRVFLWRAARLRESSESINKSTELLLDLVFAQANLQLMIDEQPTTPYESLNVIISDVIYGGRVTDKQDVRLTRAILGLYLNDSAVDDDAYSYCPQIRQHYDYGVPPEVTPSPNP